jgi:ribosomal protein S18 acetylase RimI-like enzyme
MYGNARFLKDLLSYLLSSGSVLVVAEEKDVVGGMVLARSEVISKFVGPTKLMKAVLGLYGSQLKLLRGFKSSRKFMDLIKDSYHGLFVYVERDHRKKGISKKMWALAEKSMSGKITLLVDKANAVSQNWCASQGFALSGGLDIGSKSWTLYSKNTE